MFTWQNCCPSETLLRAELYYIKSIVIVRDCTTGNVDSIYNKESKHTPSKVNNASNKNLNIFPYFPKISL